MKENVTILMVDDEDDILDFFATEADAIATKVLTANRPLAAIELAKNERVDLAVLDYRMPEMDGIELFAELKKLNPDICCIFLSAQGDKPLLQSALRQGAVDFLDKPCDFDDFAASLRVAIEKIKQVRLKTAALGVAKMITTTR